MLSRADVIQFLKSTWFLILGLLLIAGALAFEFVKVDRAAQPQPLTQLDLALFDALTFFLGGVGLLIVGMQVTLWQSERYRAPHAKSAFLRAVELYQALRRFELGIDRQQESLTAMADQYDRVKMNAVRLAFDGIRAQVGEQVLTAAHAMTDWQTQIPSTVAEIEQQARGANEEAPNA